jgi:hypothetical protein
MPEPCWMGPISQDLLFDSKGFKALAWGENLHPP